VLARSRRHHLEAEGGDAQAVALAPYDIKAIWHVWPNQVRQRPVKHILGGDGRR